MRVVYKLEVLAESDDSVDLVGTTYFPPDSLNRDYFRPTDTHTVCSLKGVASYYNVEVDGEVLTDAAWVYPDTKDGYGHIEGYVAFYTNNGVQLLN